MKPTRRKKLDRLLREMLEDETLDLEAVAATLRAWAVRFDFRAASRWADSKSPDRGGRPRLGEATSILDEVDPAFGPGLIDHFAKLVRAFRPSARRTRNPVVFRDRLPAGRDLLAGWRSGDPDFPEMFRRRFADVTMEPGTPRLAAARLALWSLGEDDSAESAERLLFRYKAAEIANRKKREKTRL